MDSSQEQYKILQKLGAGGMGTVYLAMDQKLKRKVAIKVLNSNISHDSSSYKRFVREIEVSAKLDHPHIVKIYQVQLNGEFPQLIMEYIQGKPWMDYVADATLKIHGKLELIQKVALAVEYAHKKNIIHRDIKPSNIMVRDNGEPVLMDFGIAKVTKVEDKSLTRTGEIVGTLEYMSPEQAMGARRDVDHRTDIYSLGAVLYQTLTGQTPISAPTLIGLLNQIANAEIAPLRKLNPEIPVEVESICMKAMAQNKENRYGSAYAFASDISNFLKGRKIVASSFVKQQKWHKIAKKAGLPLGIVAALALIVVIIFYVIVPNMMQSRHEQEFIQTLSSDYQEAQVLIQSGSIEKKQEAYQKLLRAWNMGRQEKQIQSHLPLLQNIGTLLRQSGYELGVYWWPLDQEKSIEYFVNLQATLAGSHHPDDMEKATAIEAHLAYLRGDTHALENCFANLLSKLKNKPILANKYPEILLLQAKMNYKSQKYKEAILCLNIMPPNQYQKESFYYGGMCQYHEKNFQRAEELLWKAYQTQDTKLSHYGFQYDLAMYLAESVTQQFAYQKIPIARCQPIFPILEELGQKTKEMSPEQLQHYLEMQGRYYIEMIAQNPERNLELGQQVLDLANRNLQNDPLHAPSYLQRGFAYYHLGKLALAWENYDYAFQLDPQQIDAIEQIWKLFPYYMDVSDDCVEKFNSMVLRWGVKSQVTPLDVCKEDFIQLRQQYQEAQKKLSHIPFNQENFNKFYRNLSQPSKDIRNLAKTALISMVPHQETLQALEKAMQEPGTKEGSLLAKELRQLIQQQEIQEEQIHWCHLVSRIPYYGLIPLQTLEYVQTQEPFLKFLRQKILEQPTAPVPELQKNWLLLQFLAARILAQLPMYSADYGKEFLYDFMNDVKQPLELRIIVAKALHDVGFTYWDHSFLESYIRLPKNKYHGKFLDIQVALLLISPREDDRRLLIELVNTTPYQVVPMLMYYHLPESETSFLSGTLEPLCFKALQSDDRDVRMVAILNMSVIQRYRGVKRSSQKNIIDIPNVLLNAIRQSQYPNIQKAALYNLIIRRSAINQECAQELEKLLDHPNPELKLLAISVLAGLWHPRILDMLFDDKENLQENIAFFYGLAIAGDDSQNRQQGMIETGRFLKDSRSGENRGAIYYMSCYLLSWLFSAIGPNEKIAIENQTQLLAYNYLKEKNPPLLFWTLAGLMGLDSISNVNLKLIQNIQQDMTMPLHIRKIATSVLLYTEVKQKQSSQQPMFDQIVTQIRNNPKDPDELWQAVVFAYKHALRNHASDFFANYIVIGEADHHQTWDYYILRFRRNMVDADLRRRFQKSLENIIAVLDLYPEHSQQQKEQWIQAIYFLALLHIQNEGLPTADAILGKENRYLRDIRLSELWIRIHPADLSKIIQHWKDMPNLSAYQQSYLLRFQAKIAMEKRDYKQSDDLLLKQYILAPSDPLSLIYMAENKLAQEDFVNAHAMIADMIYCSVHHPHADWIKARIYASQQDYDGAFRVLQYNLSSSPTAYPIRPKDLEDSLFEGMDRGTLCYYLAHYEAVRCTNAAVILWLEKALQYKTPIPDGFKKNGGYAITFDRYRSNAAFNKVWKQLEKLSK